MTSPLHPIDVTRVRQTGDTARAEAAPDVAAVEEPLEIRLDGVSFAVIMRTPGADRELAAGFLLAERIIGGFDDLGVIRHCTDPQDGHVPNVLDVTLGGGAAARASQALADRRLVTTNSSCGVCGRRTIDDLMTGIEPLPVSWRVPARTVASVPQALRAAQAVFDETGGLHGAGLFDRAGRLLSSAEDVGRHNAVDKVIGVQLLLDRLPLSDRLLVVSGRASYEIVQKALVARVPLVASVSAPSSLAIDLARQGGITLLGFVRGDTFNIYTGHDRIELS